MADPLPPPMHTFCGLIFLVTIYKEREPLLTIPSIRPNTIDRSSRRPILRKVLPPGGPYGHPLPHRIDAVYALRNADQLPQEPRLEDHRDHHPRQEQRCRAQGRVARLLGHRGGADARAVFRDYGEGKLATIIAFFLPLPASLGLRLMGGLH